MRKSVFKESISRGKSFLLLMLLALTLSAATVSATEGGTDPGTSETDQGIQCGAKVYVTFAGDTLTVHGTGPMADFPAGAGITSGTGIYASIDRNNIKKIVIASGVTYIGKFAFENAPCTELKIGDTVTKIGQRAFWKAYNLTSVDIPGNVKNIGAGAFRECNKLGNCMLNKGTEKIGDYAFYKTSALKTITIPESVTSIDTYAFQYSGLSEVKIPAAVKTIGKGAFGKVTATIYGKETDPAAGAFAAGSTLIVYEGSKADTYAKASGLNIIYFGCTEENGVPRPHSWDAGKVTKASTCKEKGVKTYTCTVCGATKTEEIGLSDHSYGIWIQTKAPTVFAKGSRRRTCSVCGYIETKNVKKVTPVIALNTKKLTLSPGENYKLAVTAMGAGDSVKSWTSTNKKVATVGSAGKVKAKAAGTAKIKVKLKSGLSATVKVTVSKVATKELSVTAKNAKLKNGKISIKAHKTFKLVAKVKPSNSSNKVTFSSSKKSVATVNGSGKVTTKKKGTTKITVKSGKKKVTITVKVK